MNRILDELYIRKLDVYDDDNLEDVLNSLDSDLKEWDARLPAHLKYVPSSSDKSVPPPHVFSILAIYNVLLILLHRPFVSDGHLNSKFSTRAANSFIVCVAAAKRIVSLIRAYDYYFSTVKAPYLISYSTYVAATILVRLASQKESGSDAHAGLKTCLDTFKENQATNWGVRRMTLVIENLATRMGVNISDGDRRKKKKPSTNDDGPKTSESIGGQSAESTATPSSVHDLSPDYTNYNTNDIYNDLDMDFIVQSFVRGQQSTALIPPSSSSSDLPIVSPIEQQSTVISPAVVSSGANGGSETSFIDLLFGFNGSVVDDLLWDDRNAPQKNF